MPRPCDAQGCLLPGVPAMACWDAAGELELVDFCTGQRTVAAGRFGEEVRAALEGAPPGPALQALPREHPIAAWLATVGAEQRLPLGPAEALQLGGFRTLFLELTGRCNQRCVHCYAHGSPAVGSALTRETCDSLLAEVPALGFEHVQLTGGEPLLCPFLPELVAQIAALAGPACEIYTNGLLLDDACLDALAPHRPHLALSFYSCDPAVHDAITRAPGSQRRTGEAIVRAVARGLYVRVAVIATPQNADHVADTIAYVEDLGASRVSAGRAFAVGRGAFYEGRLPPAPHAALEEPAAAPTTPARRGRLCVAHDGAVYPCIFNRRALLGRVPERRLREIAADPWPVSPVGESPTEQLAALRCQLPCVECQMTAYALARVNGGL